MIVADFRDYSISSAFLDISTLNVESEKVAEKAGYIKNHVYGHLDPQHEELDFLFHWEKKLHSQRDIYFVTGITAFNQKDYSKAEVFFTKAIAEKYEGGPNTDALCYSNLGMACSGSHKYGKAFQCLKKAQSLGLTNASIEKELNWLKIYKGLY